MSEMKKIILSLPEELLEKVDDQLKYEEISRSEWIRRALVLALEQAKKDRIRARMKQGYQEMGLLNLELAEEALAADTSDFAIYEKVLLESE
ncbi:MAG: CopG family transcriptional regulator [Firmicutes bacterium]|nr:CopG family transcriptional regulator [Bacillota bacterium]